LRRREEALQAFPQEGRAKRKLTTDCVTAVVKKLQNQLYGTEQQVQFKKLDAEKHNCDSKRCNQRRD